MTRQPEVGRALLGDILSSASAVTACPIRAMMLPLARLAEVPHWVTLPAIRDTRCQAWGS
jgi:hypothetical protein